MTWDPACYCSHFDHRLRPGLELLARIPVDPRTVYDLGCGTGELTHQIGKRWREARVVGIDNSPEMLAKATGEGNVTFVEADIETWEPDDLPDLIYSNAALHWLPDHRSLFPRLLSLVRPGGVLAVQMPDNWNEPTHQSIYAEVDSRGWTARLADLLLRNPVAGITDYVAWLRTEIDAWRTTYFQVMSGADPVLSWVRGSVLVPLRSELSIDEYRSLEEALSDRYRRAYPPQPDGTTLLPISRIFLVAGR